ncbi:MAG: hypothetical protein II001_02260, partial [Bacteroidales bacterium]|nr:hypothetical protein [Bacteroidales bacterium]
MNKKISLLLIAVLMTSLFTAFANEGDTTAVIGDKKPKKDKPKKEKNEVRTGGTFGLRPSVAFGADQG